MLALFLRGLFFVPAEKLPALVFVIAFVLLWTLSAWRIGRMGVYISDRGVRVRSPFPAHQNRTMGSSDS